MRYHYPCDGPQPTSILCVLPGRYELLRVGFHAIQLRVHFTCGP
jgi:hypothetical protein